MKKFSLAFILLLIVLTPVSAQPMSASKMSGDERAIRSEIEKQRLAWNTGNLKAFMDTYWRSDSLMFIGQRGVTYGWEKTLANYEKSYPDTIAMGKLNFDVLEVKRLSVMYLFIVGKWHLTRSIGDVGGHFTLLFRKVKNKWVIVADHSS